MIKQSIKSAKNSISKALICLAKSETIDSGETLSGLAQKHYGDQSLWPLIAIENQMLTPQQAHLIPLGKQIKIPTKRPLNNREQNLLDQYKEKYHSSNKKQDFNFKQQTSPNSQNLDYHQKLRKNILLKEQKANELGLVDISNSGFILKYPDCNYLDPKLVSILTQLSKSHLTDYIRITEAFPAISKHTSRTHFNGQAADFTISDPKYSDQIVKFLKSKGFKALNEYRISTRFTQGGHIHISL